MSSTPLHLPSGRSYKPKANNAATTLSRTVAEFIPNDGSSPEYSPERPDTPEDQALPSSRTHIRDFSEDDRPFAGDQRLYGRVEGIGGYSSEDWANLVAGRPPNMTPEGNALPPRPGPAPAQAPVTPGHNLPPRPPARRGPGSIAAGPSTSANPGPNPFTPHQAHRRRVSDTTSHQSAPGTTSHFLLSMDEPAEPDTIDIAIDALRRSLHRDFQMSQLPSPAPAPAQGRGSRLLPRPPQSGGIQGPAATPGDWTPIATWRPGPDPSPLAAAHSAAMAPILAVLNGQAAAHPALSSASIGFQAAVSTASPAGLPSVPPITIPAQGAVGSGPPSTKRKVDDEDEAPKGREDKRGKWDGK